jgi:hypothetical protein
MRLVEAESRLTGLISVLNEEKEYKFKEITFAIYYNDSTSKITHKAYKK